MQRVAFNNILHYNITNTNPGCGSPIYAMEITSATQTWTGNVTTCNSAATPPTCTFVGDYSVDAAAPVSQSNVTATCLGTASLCGMPPNVLLVTTATINNFVSGENLYLTGFTGASSEILNGQTVTVSVTGPTQFEATGITGSYSPETESTGIVNGPVGYQVLGLRNMDPVYISKCSGPNASQINMRTQTIGAKTVAAVIGPPGNGSTAWSGTSWSPANLTVTYPWATTGNPSDMSETCTISNIQGNPQFLNIDHNTLITDAVESVGVGPDLTKGANFQLQHLFRNSIILSSPGATTAGWYNPAVGVEGLPNPTLSCPSTQCPYGTENFNYDVSSLTAAYLVWPGRSNANYTEFPNNSTYSDAGCSGGPPPSPGWVGGPPAYCYPPNTMYFPATSYCTTLNPNYPVYAPGQGCVGFLGALNLPTGPMPLALTNYHGYQLVGVSTGSSYFHDRASDGTDMGVIIPSLDTAQTTNLYVCTSSCGSPGPFPD
jgi:hypothetical protein